MRPLNGLDVALCIAFFFPSRVAVFGEALVSICLVEGTNMILWITSCFWMSMSISYHTQISHGFILGFNIQLESCICSFIIHQQDPAKVKSSNQMRFYDMKPNNVLHAQWYVLMHVIVL